MLLNEEQKKLALAKLALQNAKLDKEGKRTNILGVPMTKVAKEMEEKIHAPRVRQ